MNFLRLLIVVTATTLSGGSFGAVVGGLIGYSIPDAMDVFLRIDRDLESHTLYDEPEKRLHQGAAHVAIDTNQSKLGIGAAAGGAWGLILGAMIGLALGVIDQILLALYRWNETLHGPMSSGKKNE